jgi:hypothetical protein
MLTSQESIYNLFYIKQAAYSNNNTQELLYFFPLIFYGGVVDPQLGYSDLWV